MSKDAVFLNEIAREVLALVNQSRDNTRPVLQKSRKGDYATQIDLAVEALIVKEIARQFPGDSILAEEKYSDTKIGDERIWIIDPICGTENLGRGIQNFCTNIALSHDKTLVASCVIDHSRGDYFWSVGDNKVYCNDSLLQPRADDLGVVVDLDLGALPKVGNPERIRHSKAALRLLTETDYTFISLNSSLCFAYTAVGKLDGFLNVFAYPWDICAAAFLIQQSGKIITDLEGKPWRITSNAAIAARNKEIHAKLLEAYAGA